MARLLAAEHASFPPESFEHVPIAHIRRQDANPVLLHQPVEAEIRHHGDRYELDAELRRQDGEDLIPVHDLAHRVDREHPVAVAVERDSEVGSGVDDRPAQGGKVGRAAAFVDVRPVGIGADRGHLGPERRERLGRDPRVGAVCAVDHDSAAAEIGAETLDHVLEIAVGGDVDAVDRAAARLWSVEQRLDLVLRAVGELVAVGVEELDAVVLGRVVRGRDHDAEIEREERHGRGR